MPHKFTESNSSVMQGVWYKHNGRRHCSWHFDPESSVLRANRGAVVHSATLKEVVGSPEELREKLPQLALELANGRTVH